VLGQGAAVTNLSAKKVLPKTKLPNPKLVAGSLAGLKSGHAAAAAAHPSGPRFHG